MQTAGTMQVEPALCHGFEGPQGKGGLYVAVAAAEVALCQLDVVVVICHPATQQAGQGLVGVGQAFEIGNIGRGTGQLCPSAPVGGQLDDPFGVSQIDVHSLD